MSENKTVATAQSVAEFLETIPDEQKRSDCQAICDLMQEVTGLPPVMWGSAIIGFGSYHYKYESGREGDAPLVGFSPRKQNITLYIVEGFEPHKDLMEKLGSHSTGMSCLYIKKISDIDLDVLRKLIKISVDATKKRYPAGS
ncbi:MAG: hypothetical protein K0S20_205 [Patescibacteria group bacterium]|jgi:hypothetical protein|nr:hypothetical protein [Patescibacteria group bacterium]